MRKIIITGVVFGVLAGLMLGHANAQPLDQGLMRAAERLLFVADTTPFANMLLLIVVAWVVLAGGLLGAGITLLLAAKQQQFDRRRRHEQLFARHVRGPQTPFERLMGR
jgi:hypothetical protein